MVDAAQSEATAPLAGRTAIVTGGGVHIGRAVAVRFASAGARVVVASRNRQNLDATVRTVREAGGEAHAVPTDATDPAQVDALVQTAIGLCGSVDVLAAIAGGGAVDAPLDASEPDSWERVWRANVASAFLCTRAVLPRFRQADRGSILLCSGGGAYLPVLGSQIAAYACAKAAVCRLTDQLTAELWDTGIRVHCIDPGLVWRDEQLAAIEETERATGRPHPQRTHNRSPEDAAELALWLASDASAPLRGRLVSVYDTWWRDPEQVRRVHESLHLYRLRRCEP